MGGHVALGSDLEIALADPADAEKTGFVAQVTDLINVVYAEAEKGLWQPDTDRTNVDEVAAVVRARELAVARLDGHLVGAVRLQRLDGDLGEFGMLVASPQHRGIGIGRLLVAFAEGWARDRNLGVMQLELLVPRTWTHPVKEFLRGWYTRIGYRRVRTGRLDEAYPALQPLLATPRDFTIYHKDL
jgi:GNAT superfamily N-acetyltransferase